MPEDERAIRELHPSATPIWSADALKRAHPSRSGTDRLDSARIVVNRSLRLWIRWAFSTAGTAARREFQATIDVTTSFTDAGARPVDKCQITASVTYRVRHCRLRGPKKNIALPQ
jgi:hypothetical protein